MAELKINEIEEVQRHVIAGERIWLNEAGDKLVAEGHPDAASLFASEGKRISRADAIAHGLVKATAAEKKELAEEAASENAEERENEPKASDAAAKLAEKEGIDLSAIEGSGKGGAITKGDVDQALAEKEA